ncbi:HAD family hydrolase [Scytonema sp. NUACC26]|uniref:HAD family hydrolase n=1 Tax=Scytonema sp. NUACC26 TaxID=3140176 RepID=UPI0034DC5762
MQPRFIDGFDVILLDMGNTFMFEAERFSETENFGATYQQIGGNFLSDEVVNHIIKNVCNTMFADYENPNYYENFPSVSSYLKNLDLIKDLPCDEISLLEQVFVMHEVGIISEPYVSILHQLRQTHQLGVVSNIWSTSNLYRQEFERVGIAHLFDVIIFSSEHGCIKPSPRLFRKAVELLAVEPSKIVFVGDSIKYDIAGAQAVGLSTVWINRYSEKLNESSVCPDLIIENLQELLESP